MISWDKIVIWALHRVRVDILVTEVINRDLEHHKVSEYYPRKVSIHREHCWTEKIFYKTKSKIKIKKSKSKETNRLKLFKNFHKQSPIIKKSLINCHNIRLVSITSMIKAQNIPKQSVLYPKHARAHQEKAIFVKNMTNFSKTK